ncbi:MAG: ABC transporter substrate-binding protein, partial [Actinomycetota bacterium]|nr:ABC transporter substrate-binding protein [Actinomycetota bacterium]
MLVVMVLVAALLGPPGAGADAPQTKLTVGETFAIPTTNPAVSTAGAVHAYWEIMYNGLIALDADGMPVPELAERVPTVANGDITNGGATYTLHLRSDVFWHDGQPFTAADVKFTFEKALLPFHGRTGGMASALASWDSVNRVASIDVVDDHTVRFRFANPYAPLLKQLNVTEAPMNPAHLYTGNPTIAQLNANTVGTGPMTYNGVTATEARVVRNPNYFRAPLPYLEEIVMRPYIDDNARFQALINGDVDFVWDVPDPRVAELRANPRFQTAATQSLGGGANSIDQLIFNLTASGDRRGQKGGPDPTGTPDPHPILGGFGTSSGAKVRLAIAHAIDRAAYLNKGRSGIGTVATAPISSELPFHATDITLPSFDQATANQLLEQAGWTAPPGFMSGSNPRRALNHPNENHANPALQIPDGTPLTLRMLAPSNIFDARNALLKEQLGAVGINLQVAPPGNTGNVVFRDRNFDTSIINFAQGYDPHIGVRRQYHSDQVSITAATNATGYKNAAVDAAFDQAVQTIDPAVRYQKYHDFQVQVAADLPYVWLIETPNVRGFITKCSGFQVHTGLFAEAAFCGQPAGPPPSGSSGASSSGLASTGLAGLGDGAAPDVSGYGLTNRSFVVGRGPTPTFGNAAAKKPKTGTTFRYTLSEPATVKIVIARARSGRRKNKRCVAPTRKLRRAARCVRLTLQGTL